MRGLVSYVTLSLAALAVVLGFSQALTFRLAGFKPIGQLTAGSLADPEAVANDLAAARFLEERDRLEVEILRDMTLGTFLRLYQLAEQPHVRAQIAAQEQQRTLADGYLLRKGRRYRITLTPPAPPSEGREPASGKAP